MIRQGEIASNAWGPQGFDEFLRHYPATQWQPAPQDLDLSDDFCSAWSEAKPVHLERAAAVVLTPGLFAEWLPGCFSAASDAFRNAGHRTMKSRVRTGVSVFAQARRLVREVSAWLEKDEPFIWCGHSKGGLELLRALDIDIALRRRCVAAIVVQPPVGRSHVLEFIGSPEASLGQKLSNYVLGTRAFATGVRDISATRDPELSRWLSRFRPCVPTVCTASWSIEPTSWIDSWHQILERVCPGIAHDGQFLTQDQVLPETPLIALPRIDHAQPVLGGHGFDPGRFWMTLAHVAAGPRLQRHRAPAI